MFSQDVFVEFLSFMEFAHCFVQAGQIIWSGDRNGIVVMLIVFPFSFGPFERCKKVFLQQRTCSSWLRYHCLATQSPAEHTHVRAHTHLGLSKVAQSEMKSPQVVEDLWGNISLDLLLQNAGGRAICRQSSLNICLLEDLSQLNPRLHVIWVLLCYLLQMTLGNKDNNMSLIASISRWLDLIPDSFWG